jgi:hypothetical protein
VAEGLAPLDLAIATEPVHFDALIEHSFQWDCLTQTKPLASTSAMPWGLAKAGGMVGSEKLDAKRILA